MDDNSQYPILSIHNGTQHRYFRIHHLSNPIHHERSPYGKRKWHASLRYSTNSSSELSIYWNAIYLGQRSHTLLLGVAATAVGISLGVMMRLYMRRKREDVLPNEHIFAERYYSKDN